MIRAIQDGGAEGIRRMAESAMLETSGSVEGGPVGLHYVRVAAFYTLGDYRSALAACDLMLAAAVREEHPGWRAKALATRADCRTVLAAGDASGYDTGVALRDLVGAEAALAEGIPDVYVRGIAHVGIGIGYFRLRLYELAEPHYTAAYRLGCQNEHDGPRPTVSSANLAELHLHWALELDRMGDAAAALDHVHTAEEHALLAHRHAPADAFWRELADLLIGCARAWHGDPADAAQRIQAVAQRILDRGHLDWWLFSVPFRALALDRAGRRAEGIALAADALQRLPEDSDWRVAAAVAYAHAALLAEDGEPGPRTALRYGASLAGALWRQRLSTLHTAQTLRSYEQLRIEHEQVSRSAESDPLTGIPNRRAFDREVERHATTGPGKAAVLVIDLDKLKQLNDDLGHAAGDRALRAVATALAGQVREGDLVARTGGDEFYALLDGADPGIAMRVADRMVRAVRDLATVVTVSVGVASGSSVEVRQTLGRADEAMYRAKQAGGDRVCAAAPPFGPRDRAVVPRQPALGPPDAPTGPRDSVVGPGGPVVSPRDSADSRS